MAKNNYSGEKKRRGIFRRLMAPPFLVLGWIAAGIVCLLLAGIVFYPHRNALMLLLSDLKIGPKVFHTKIPEEIKNEQNLFRRKIPAVDQTVTPKTKIETTPPVAKAMPSQPTDASSEQSEPQQEIELVQPLETQTKIETTPPVAEAVPSQPTDAPSGQSEPQQEIELVQPVETQTKIETIPPMAKAVPSQPTDGLSEKSEPRQETQPRPPAEPKTKIETVPPIEEQSVSSQPTAAPFKRRELPEKAELRQAEVRPPQAVIEDTIEKTKERSIHSEKWLLSQEASYYTIQLMGVRKEALLFDFVQRNQLLEQNEIAFYQTTFKEKPWFQLLYGVYATKKDAQSAADNLSPKIRKSSPWIRRLSAVQKAIRRKAAQ